jgi:hypothetical protein
MTTQNEPVEEGSSEATDTEKVDGIVEQTRQDLSLGSIAPGELRDVIAQRLSDAGITVDAAELDRLAEAASSEE